MLTRVYSAALVGVDAVEVEIEVNETQSDSGKIYIVGLPDTAVKESKDRVFTAVANSGYWKPRGTTTINLAPGDLKKEGPSFDLAMALGMIALRENLEPGALEPYCVVGELALNGRVRPVHGVLPIAIEARKQGKRALLVPHENAAEASVVEGIDVYGISNLREAFEHLRTGNGIYPVKADIGELFAHHGRSDVDFADVKGQSHVKRAIEVAIAGSHNLLMVGPPGTGKSMLAKRIPTVMPAMTREEAIETTKIHSIAGMLDRRKAFLATRPYRAPHHTISDIGLLGGSNNPRPGEVSLAHNGVLFLDELPEFRRSTLEVMRQPLEDGRVTISRASGTMTFPSNFMLVCAMNPCPCGYMGDPKRECRCNPGQIQKYRQRISGPLLDRIDLHVEVPIVEYRELAGDATGETSDTIRERVEAARLLQQERYREQPSVNANSEITPKLMKEHCRIDAESSGFLEHAMTELNFSARAHDRVLKVARTLADLDSSESIQSQHILEAIQDPDAGPEFVGVRGWGNSMPQAPYRLFAELSRIADEIGSKFLVVGGHAVGFYGVPRETADVDIVIVEDFVGGWIRALELLKYGVYHRNPNFVQLHHVDGRDWPVDLILLDADTFSKMEARSATKEVADLVLPLPALNDLIAMKLHALKQGLAHRYAKDFQDVQIMVERNGIDLQNDAIIEMFLKFGNEDIYKQVCHACESSPGGLL